MVPLELRGDRMLIKFICKMHLDHRTAIEQLMGQNRDRELAARNAELSVLRLRVSSLSLRSARRTPDSRPYSLGRRPAGRNKHRAEGLRPDKEGGGVGDVRGFLAVNQIYRNRRPRLDVHRRLSLRWPGRRAASGRRLKRRRRRSGREPR